MHHPTIRHARLAGKVFVLLSPLLFGCGHQEAAERAQKPLPKIGAAVLTLEPRPWPTIVRSQGSLAADEVAVVGAKVGGRVKTVHVDLGDPVRAGNPLTTLEQEEFVLQVSQAEAQLAQARSAVGLKPPDAVETLNPENAPPVRQEHALWNEAKTNAERARRLRSQNAVSPAEFDQIIAAERVAEARYSSALNSVYEKIALIGVRQAELSLARQRLEDAIVRAPFDGVVQQRQVAPGAFVQIGSPVVTLVRTNPLRFRAMMPERYAQSLTIGQQVHLRIESVAQPHTVRVTRISPALDQLSRSLLFEAELDNSDRKLRSGLFAEAEVVLNAQARAIIVPPSAVVEFAGTEKVWKVTNGVAGEHEVLTGQRRPTGIEILAGLSAGDVVLCDASKGQVALIKPLPGQLDKEALVRKQDHSSPPGSD